MEPNEVMENEVVVVENEEAVEHSGMSTGMAMVVGGLITTAVIAGVKKAKKLWANHKAKQEQLKRELLIDDGTIDYNEDRDDESEE